MILFTLLAFFIPIPLFYNLTARSFFIEKNVVNKILIDAGVPIPIGLPALFFIIVLSFIHRQNIFIVNRKSAVSLFLVSAFLALMSWRLDPLKLIAVVLPILLLLTLAHTVGQPRVFERISRGYLAGLICQVSLHLGSIFFYNGLKENIFWLCRSFYGYEIYQALLSYSAVMSMFGCGLLIFLAVSRGRPERLKIFALACGAFLLVQLSNRKAGLLDMGLMLLVDLYLVLRVLRFSGGVNRRRFTTGISVGLFLIVQVGIFFALSNSVTREVSVDFVMEQRGGAYLMFFESLKHIGFVDALIGYVPGWGGYSNYFLELFIRSGLIGLFSYLFAFIYALRRFLQALVSHLRDSAFIREGNGVYLTSWFVFAITTLVASNLFNMNIQLPYYSINFLMLNICFVYYCSRSGEEASGVGEPPRLQPPAGRGE